MTLRHLNKSRGADPLVLTVDEVAKVLRVSRQTAYEAVRRGELPTLRMGRRILVPRAALLKLLGLEEPA